MSRMRNGPGPLGLVRRAAKGCCEWAVWSIAVGLGLHRLARVGLPPLHSVLVIRLVKLLVVSVIFFPIRDRSVNSS